MEDQSADVVVIGGGFSGLSAAVRLADAGQRVVVLEAAPRLGGRATSFVDRTTGQLIDNGQHVLFGCYRETYAFLQRLGTAHLAPLDRGLALSMAGNDGRAHALSCPPLPAPWHLLAGVLKWTAVPLADRWRVFKVARAIRHRTAGRSTDGAPDLEVRGTVTQWLEVHGQTPELRRWLWTPLAFAALNQSPDTAAAEPFVRVLQELFGPRAEDSAIGLPAVPLAAMYAEPAAGFIEARGGRVITKAIAHLTVGEGNRVLVFDGKGRRLPSRSVVSAVPWHAFSQLWQDGCPAEIEPICAAARAMASSPIVTVNLWFEGPVSQQRFIGLPDGRMHWAFNVGSVLGEPNARVSMVSSGAGELAAMNNDEIAGIALADLHAAFPSARAVRVSRSLVVREHRATFSLAPGAPPRPNVSTPLPGFYIAGDWTDTALPATIEGAVRSGHAAADRILERDAGLLK